MKDYETQSLLIIIKFVLVFIKTKKNQKFRHWITWYIQEYTKVKEKSTYILH